MQAFKKAGGGGKKSGMAAMLLKAAEKEKEAMREAEEDNAMDDTSDEDNADTVQTAAGAENSDEAGGADDGDASAQQDEDGADEPAEEKDDEPNSTNAVAEEDDRAEHDAEAEDGDGNHDEDNDVDDEDDEKAEEPPVSREEAKEEEEEAASPAATASVVPGSPNLRDVRQSYSELDISHSIRAHEAGGAGDPAEEEKHDHDSRRERKKKSRGRDRDRDRGRGRGDEDQEDDDRRRRRRRGYYDDDDDDNEDDEDEEKGYRDDPWAEQNMSPQQRERARKRAAALQEKLARLSQAVQRSVNIRPDPDFKPYLSRKERKQKAEEDRLRAALKAKPMVLSPEATALLTLLQRTGPPDPDLFKEEIKVNAREFQTWVDDHRLDQHDIGRVMGELFDVLLVADLQSEIRMREQRRREAEERVKLKETAAVVAKELAAARAEYAALRARLDKESRMVAKDAFRKGCREGAAQRDKIKRAQDEAARRGENVLMQVGRAERTLRGEDGGDDSDLDYRIVTEFSVLEQDE